MATPLPLPLKVRHTRRRGSIALRVSAEAIQVLAPQGTPAGVIEALVKERREWIEAQAAACPPRPRYGAGEHLGWQGERLPLFEVKAYATEEKRPPDTQTRRSRCYLERTADRFLIHLNTRDLDSEARRQAVLHWYQQEAESCWPQRLAYWSRVTGLAPERLKIRYYRSRWGACTAKGVISLNSLLLMAPLPVQDYVMIHELCHLRHLDHSPAYWALVDRFCPERRACRSWLRTEGARLALP